MVENGNDFASVIKGDVGVYKMNAKKSLSIKPDEIALLFVGQHIWEKGLDVVVETLRRMKDNVRFKMNFIGTGYAAGEIAERIKNYGLEDRVAMHGVITCREELCRYYAGSDLFLFPSFYDNAPLVVREAAAMGTPSILLKGSTASEVISDGKNGFLIDKDPGEFASLISRLHDNREELLRVGQGARSSLVRSWEDVVDEVSDRYESIIKRFNVG